MQEHRGHTGTPRNAGPGLREQWAANADATISRTLWATHETRIMGVKGPSEGKADRVRLLDLVTQTTAGRPQSQQVRGREVTTDCGSEPGTQK